MLLAGLHGLGRFGQHALLAWLQAPGKVEIGFLADEVLSGEQVCALLRTHDRLDFAFADPVWQGGCLWLSDSMGVRRSLPYFQGPATLAPWLGLPDIWLECSGRYASKAACMPFLRGNTQQVLVSATCEDADQTLLMGWNQAAWQARAKVLSYGSCTINAFVPLADWLHRELGVRDAQVQVIHNVPAYRLADCVHPLRTSCTLQAMAPRLLPWLADEQLDVLYTLIPYSGVSLLDLQFRVERPLPLAQLLHRLQHAVEQGALAGLYALPASDPGGCQVLGQPFNAVFPLSGIRLRGDSLRLSGYLDNENSAYRYIQLVKWLAGEDGSFRK